MEFGEDLRNFKVQELGGRLVGRGKQHKARPQQNFKPFLRTSTVFTSSFIHGFQTSRSNHNSRITCLQDIHSPLFLLSLPSCSSLSCFPATRAFISFKYIYQCLSAIPSHFLPRPSRQQTSIISLSPSISLPDSIYCQSI